MKNIRVFEKYASIPYITIDKAEFIYDLVIKNKPEHCLELGFFHGKSSAVIAQALEENGKGRLVTMDLPSAEKRNPNIHQILAEVGLAHRVEVVMQPEGFHWSLMDLLEKQPQPRFDFAYIDGAHTWTGTGFALLLLERMLKPGAWLVFDDLDWTIQKSNLLRATKGRSLMFPEATERELTTRGVRKVFELLCTYPRYTDQREFPSLHYGVCRKT